MWLQRQRQKNCSIVQISDLQRKANKYAKEYGKHLIKKLFEKLNPMTYEKAVEMERTLAEELQGKGYGVWWN